MRLSPPPHSSMAENQLNQLLDFDDIGPSRALTPKLRQWLLGTRIISHEDEAKPWLEVLWRYRCEWVQLAHAHRHVALPWAERLIQRDTERYANASGF